jgi:nitronate monooxygenase
MDNRILDLFKIEVPIIQAPMAGFVTSDLILGVAQAGGLGSLPLATVGPAEARKMFDSIRQRSARPVNCNFFCHEPPVTDPVRAAAWMRRVMPYYAEFGLDPEEPPPSPPLLPFGDVHCSLMEELRPEIVSFHFGLPAPDLLDRVRRTGAKIISTATTVREAVWLEQAGCDAIIAQGFEAGGHRGMFLPGSLAAQIGTMALVPQVVDAVKVPVVAAGGIGDPRGVAAAFALGASAVQIGTAYLFCEEANVSSLYRRVLRAARDDQTVITNVFTGRPARAASTRIVREVGPISEGLPAFPLAAAALSPLRAASEARGSTDFTPVWCGQAAHLGRELSATELTRWLSCDLLKRSKDGDYRSAVAG